MKVLIRLLSLGALLGAFTTAPLWAANWETWENCRYVANLANRGDVFHIRCGQREEVVRLYAVAESNARAAANFTREQLTGKAFQVVTCHQSADDAGAVYAYVLIGAHDLGQGLLAHGLARVAGPRPARPGVSYLKHLGELRDAEAQARAQGRGLWAGAAASNLVPLDGYRLSTGKIRHNSKCRYFDLKGNQPCGPNDGTPCKYCGG